MRNQTITKVWGKYRHRRGRGHKKKITELAWSAPIPVAFVDEFRPTTTRDCWHVTDEVFGVVALHYKSESGMPFYRLSWHNQRAAFISQTVWMDADSITATWVTAKLTGEL